jgi:hypothetical protein
MVAQPSVSSRLTLIIVIVICSAQFFYSLNLLHCPKDEIDVCKFVLLAKGFQSLLCVITP